MKTFLAILSLLFLQGVEGTVKCFQGADAETAASDCSDTSDTLCNQPIFVEYTGLSTGTYGCGACASGTTATCEECTGNADTGCNDAEETGVDFECDNYAWDSDDSAFAAETTATTCQRLADTEEVCNAPTADATSSYELENEGCGPCDADALTAGTCEEPEDETEEASEESTEAASEEATTEESSAVTATALALPLMAVARAFFY